MNSLFNIKDISNCTFCNDNVHDERFVTHRGNANADYLLIGRDPGANEIEQGIPFCGRSGEILSAALNYNGLDIDKDCFVTNINLHRSKDNKGFNAKQRNHCFKNFVKPITQESNAKNVFLFGSDVIKTVFDSFNINHKNIKLSDMIENGFVSSETNKIFFPMYHPSYIVRNGGLKGEKFKEYCKAFKMVIDN